MPVDPIPKGFHTVTPYFVANDADRMLDFLVRGLGGKAVEELRRDDGKIMHAQIQVGNSMIMLGQSREVCPASTAHYYIYVPNCDELYAQAVAAGAKSIAEPTTQFYGDRHGAVQDSEGNTWWIATHVEEVSKEEMERRAAAAGRK